jgi:hypothetical protein
VDSIEGGPPAQVCVTIIDLEGASITVETVTTQDDTGKWSGSQQYESDDHAIFTATAGSDYTMLTSMGLGFPPSPMPGAMECVNISITDDTEQEMTEMFNASVSINTDTQSVPIRITDNDG